MLQSRSPQRPDELLLEVEPTGAEGVAAAVGRARAAGRDWAAAPALERSAALVAAAEALAGAAAEVTGLMVREVGKPVSEAAAEAARGVGILRYYAQQALDPDGETYPGPSPAALLLSRRRPRGVAGLITPWNFPVAIPLWKAAPALAYGNGVVLKAASEATALALRLAELLAAALPDGLFQVVPGGAATGTALIERADCVSFTGSVEVGRQVAIAATTRGIPSQVEMGGLNASIVLPDADPQRAAATVAGAAMGYAGQKCTATSRAIVVGDPAPFTDALVAAVEGLAVGDPAEQRTVVGPVINEPARRAVLEAAEQAAAAGGRMLTGGRAGDGAGWFVEPTLVDRLPPDARLAQEEVFGPIAVVLPAADEDEAVAIANGVRYGLVGAVFTRDLDRALTVAARLDTGLIRVNAPTSGVDFHAPFGGEKDSSFGPREQGKAARELYTSTRTITVLPEGG
ncbi:MAG TPA: aldehyde dehydrogenase family protein [Actinomycetes bacterium]|nr:aldehyde dehydrogenase family protein [Actinomycetes bacterium]